MAGAGSVLWWDEVPIPLLVSRGPSQLLEATCIPCRMAHSIFHTARGTLSGGTPPGPAEQNSVPGKNLLD